MNASNGGRPGGPGSTSRSLLARVRERDREAWERLVALYAPLVLHWCRRSGLSGADVSDLFQEVFQAAAGGITGFRKERPGDTFRGWLHAIAANKVRDHFRRAGREPHGVGGTEQGMRIAALPAPELESASELESVSGEPARRDRAELLLLRRAMATVEPRFRAATWQAFLRTVVDGRAARDVGEELAMSAGAVRVAKCRVLQRLREELGDLR